MGRCKGQVEGVVKGQSMQGLVSLRKDLGFFQGAVGAMEVLSRGEMRPDSGVH